MAGGSGHGDGGRKGEPLFNVPGVIVWMIAIMIAVHVYRQFLDPRQDMEFILKYSLIPARYSHGLLASGWGGLVSLISYNFLHGNLVHLMVNSLWLLAMGSAVARRIGSWRFVLFSLVCSLFAALAHLLTHWGEIAPVIGASGAISGHMAAAIRFIFSVERSHEGIRRLHEDPRSIPIKSLMASLADGRVMMILIAWLGINYVFGTGMVAVDGDSPIAWEAHIGGFLAGLFLFRWFDPPENGWFGRFDPEDEGDDGWQWPESDEEREQDKDPERDEGRSGHDR